ncbi:unnamed protein product, partial [Echinostoma caproni]|uniref:GIY-YIG domain-containing protein n=1 Tax=Echinostoma caproni TaxID=27848 RepID=A0A183ATV6_9TREM
SSGRISSTRKSQVRTERTVAQYTRPFNFSETARLHQGVSFPHMLLERRKCGQLSTFLFYRHCGLECFDEDAPSESHSVHENFFGCYLLVSQNVKYRGKTYIGFTVDPNRRIRQHNGGRCKGGGYGANCSWIPERNIRFEWAWQNPELSRRLSNQGASHQPKETPFEYRFRILSLMLPPPFHIPIAFGPLVSGHNNTSTTVATCSASSFSRCGLCLKWTMVCRLRTFHKFAY